MSRISTAHSRGQKLYRAGDFEAALKAFGEALQQKDADTVGILDNRCAASCKLEKYDQALRDARHIIKANKEDERGYLRCAQVLVLQKKPEKALEIYTYGLKMLPSTHPRRETLEYMQKKLQDGLMLNRHDPFSILPLEMAVMVLSHFSFRQIAGIMRVSKGWQRFLNSLPGLWLKMDLTGGRSRVPWPAIRSYVRQSKGNLTHAVIKNLPLNSTQKSLEFVSRCPRLENLELWVNHGYKETATLFRGFKSVKRLILGPEITVPQALFFRLLKEHRKLEHIKIMNLTSSQADDPNLTSGWPESLPNLKSIDLTATSFEHGYAKPLSLPFIDHLAFEESNMHYRPNFYPNLEEIRLDFSPPKLSYYAFCDSIPPDPVNPEDPGVQLPSLPPLRRLELHGILPGKFLFELLPDKIESLFFQGGPSIRNHRITFDDLEYSKKFSALQSLSVNDSSWFTLEALEHLLDTFQPPLQTLSLDSCPGLLLNASDLKFLANWDELKDLTELNIASMRDIDDKFATTIFEVLPKLKILDLSFTAVTGRTIRKFADARALGSDSEPKLDRLVVRNCERISSDAVLYGREKGLEVVI